LEWGYIRRMGELCSRYQGRIFRDRLSGDRLEFVQFYHVFDP